MKHRASVSLQARATRRRKFTVLFGVHASDFSEGLAYVAIQVKRRLSNSKRNNDEVVQNNFSRVLSDRRRRRTEGSGFSGRKGEKGMELIAVLTYRRNWRDNGTCRCRAA